MIYIGIDIIKISRINKIIESKGERFLSRIFTDSEQSICNGKSSPPIFYGGKYAAKEAVKKALLSSNLIKNISLNNIEIQNRRDGAPKVCLKDSKGCSANIQISISHEDEYAIATAILEIK